MDEITWVLAGLAAGWVTGIALRGQGYGVIGNLLMGSAGGVIGGWILEQVGIGFASTPLAHAVVAILGGVLLTLAVRAVDKAGRATGATAAVSPNFTLEGQLERVATLERDIILRFLRRKPEDANPNIVFDQQLSFGERVADVVATFGGSWTFIGVALLAIGAWMWVNHRPGSVDPYPFILLNLGLSCLAAMQAPIIMMSQNRQAAKDRSDAQQDYQVNLKAELEILALHTKLDEAREHDLRRIIEMQDRQIALLTRLVDRA